MAGFIASIAGPEWFRFFETTFQIMFAVITMLIAGFGYKAYKMSEDRKFKYFTAGFFMLSIGFILLAVSNFLIYTEFYDGIVSRFYGINFANLIYFGHIVLMMAGYMLLLVIAMRLQTRRLIALLFSFLFLFALFSYQYYLKFHVISLMLLGFMAWQFFDNYREKKKFNSGLVFSGFYMLAFAELFLLGIIFVPSLYVVGNVLQLVGYGLLLWMFIRVQRGKH